MTVTKNGRFYHYAFKYQRRRYRGSTGQTDRDAAVMVDAEIQKRTRQEAWGVAPVDRLRTPDFMAWAPHFYREQTQHIKRPDFTLSCLHVLLEFFGRAPTQPRRQAAVARPRTGDAPYHDLRLLDPIQDPEWIVRFEAWMSARGISGTRKNHLRSTLSMMYKLAIQPAWRKKTGIAVNPIAGIRRDRVKERTRILTIDEIQAIMQHAPYHLRVAVAMAVLAPKLRVASILALRFGSQIDTGLTSIVVADHKAERTGRPLVVPLIVRTTTGTDSTTLRQLLTAVRTQNETSAVIEYQGRPVRSMKTATRASVTAAGLIYGTTDPQGVTFHTIRHSIATLLATFPDLSERMRAEIMGQTIQTAQRYTHLAALHQVSGHLALAAAATPITDLIGLGRNLGPPANDESPEQAHIRDIPRRIQRLKKARN